MQKHIFCLLTIILLAFISQTSWAQKAENVEVTATKEKVIVTYNLPGKKSAIYDVSLRFDMDDGKVIRPKSVRGDIGKVMAGEGKAIIWDVYKDVSGLSGKINPIIEVNEVISKNKKQKEAKKQPTPVPPPPKKTNPPVKSNNPVINMMDSIFRNNVKKKRRRTKNRFGYKIGLGSSFVESSLRTNFYQRKFSWQAGTYFRYNFHRRFYIQPEIYYHNQSYTEVLNQAESATHRYHYVRGLALAGFNPLGLGLHLNTGVYYGQLVGGKEKQFLIDGTQEFSLWDSPVQNGESSPFLGGDFGYVIGGSLNFNKGAFAIGVLYGQSFNNVVNNAYHAGFSEKENLKLRNRSIHFTLQKSFRWKK